MSGTSYPSPVSSTTSNNAEVNATPSTRVQLEATGDHIETQRSLHQASAALEAAYQRIRQVRRSLLELSDALPDAQRQARRDEIGPAHDSIMLTDSPVEDSGELGELERLRFNLPYMSERFMHYESRQSGTERTSRWRDQNAHALAENAGDTLRSLRHTPSQAISLNSPVSPARHPALIPRRSVLESHLSRRRDNHSDDPNTVLGRRVAAREAAGISRPASSSSNPIEGRVSPLTAMERDFENFRFLTRQRRSEPARLEPLPEDGTPSSADTRATRSLDVNAAWRAASASSPGYPQGEIRPWRTSRGDTRQSSSQSPVNQSGRLSVLSNFSVQNLPTPMSSLSRPLLFDEPVSYVMAANLLQEQPDDNEANGGYERNYVVRRRINEDGEELVHNVNLEWGDADPASWFVPPRERLQDELASDYALPPRPPRIPRIPLRYVDRQPNQRNDTIQVSRSLNTTTPSPDEPTRRRGWARLDADGNEIPSDEEEELERVRAEYRVRALFQSQAATGTSQNQNLLQGPRARTLSLVPVTPMSMSSSPDDDGGSGRFAENFPRVRISPRDARAFYGSVLDSVRSVDRSHLRSSSEMVGHHAVPEYPSSVAPFCADPLPMPLEQMMPYMPKTRKTYPTHVVRVPRHASLAGR